MTTITISDPDEGATRAGYYSIEIEESDALVAEFHLAPSLLPDFDDPEEMATLLRETASNVEKLEDREEPGA
jgi:hypothetical protein